MAEAKVDPGKPAEREPPRPRGPEARIERAVGGLFDWLSANRYTRFPWAVVQTFSQAQGALLSGSMAYYTFLSLLPLLMVAGFVLGTIATQNQAVHQAVVAAVAQIFPGVEGREVLNQLIGARFAFGLFGLLSVAYAGSGFVGAMTACMNQMWRVASGRNPVTQKLLNLLVVVVLGAVLLGSVGLNIWAGATARRAFSDNPGQANAFIQVLGWLASPGSMLVVLLLLYRLLPARKHSWLSQLPGAVFGALGFEILKRAFGFWASNSAGVSALPAGLVSVVLLLVWLGFFGQLILYGAALNVVWDRQRRRTPLPPDPPGAAAGVPDGPAV